MNSNSNSVCGMDCENLPQQLGWTKVETGTNNDGKLISSRHGHKMCAVDLQDLLVIFGGGNQGLVDEIHVFNTNTELWMGIQPLKVNNSVKPDGLAAFGFATDGLRLFLFGGMKKNGYSNETWMLKTVDWQWVMLNDQPEAPQPRIGHSFNIVGDQAITFGGLLESDDDSELPYQNDLYTFRLPAGTGTDIAWENHEQTAATPSPRESHTACAYTPSGDTPSKIAGNALIVHGGMNKTRLQDLHVLYLDTMQWSSLKFATYPRSLHTANIIGSKMFVFGGWTQCDSKLVNMEDREWMLSDRLSCYDIERDEWEENVNPNCFQGAPAPRAGHSSAVINKRLYMWSGRATDKIPSPLNPLLNFCHSDLWFLETVPPEAPGCVRLANAITAKTSVLSVCWSKSGHAQAYLVQIKEYYSNQRCVLTTQGIIDSDRRRQMDSDKILSSQSLSAEKSAFSTQKACGHADVNPGPPADSSVGEKLNAETNTTKPISNQAASNPACPEPVIGALLAENPSETVDSGFSNRKPEARKLNWSRPSKQPWYDVDVVPSNSCVISSFHLPENEDSSSSTTPKMRRVLSAGKSYKVRVAGINACGIGPWSPVSAFKTCLPESPSAPTNIKIVSRQDCVNVSWNPPQHNADDIVDYSLLLAIKRLDRETVAHNPGEKLLFSILHTGRDTWCQIPKSNLVSALIERFDENQPCLILRLAARTQKCYGTAVQILWRAPLSSEPTGGLVLKSQEIQCIMPAIRVTAPGPLKTTPLMVSSSKGEWTVKGLGPLKPTAPNTNTLMTSTQAHSKTIVIQPTIKPINKLHEKPIVDLLSKPTSSASSNVDIPQISEERNRELVTVTVPRSVDN